MNKIKLYYLGMHILVIKLQKEKYNEQISIKVRRVVTNQRKGLQLSQGACMELLERVAKFYFITQVVVLVSSGF